MSVVLLVCAIACFVYGVSIFLVFSGTSFFAVWFVIAAVLFAWSYALHGGVWGQVPLLLRGAWCTLAGIALVGFAALGTLVMHDAHQMPPNDLDYLVVLGAQVHRSGPSVVLRYRLDAAYDYLVANPETRCVVSGGQGPNEPFPEADGMAAYLVERGIDESRILRERRSTTTVENIAFSRRLMEGDAPRVGIVTNDFHIFRAVRIARRQGFVDAAGVPGGSVPWYLPNNLLRECLGIVKDLLAGNMTW